MWTTSTRARLRRARKTAVRLAAASTMLAATLVGLPAAPAHAAAELLVPSAFPTIQAAIDAASAGDTVVVAFGTYHEHIDFKGKAIEVRSEFHARATIDGDRLSTVVRFHTGEGRGSILRDFEITHGAVGTTLGGGGIAIEDASPTIVGNLITDNDGGTLFGAGIRVNRGAPRIEGNSITNNRTDTTGGGGGIFAVGSAEIVGNIVDRNTAGGGGGALLAGPVLFSDNYVYSNHAQAFGGGGVSLGGGHPRVVQNLITENRADVRGGGLAWTDTGTTDLPEVVNNTFVGNLAPSGSTATGDDGGVVLTNNLMVGVGGSSSVECLGAAVQLTTFSHNDAYNGGTPPFAGCPDPTGVTGNISAAPHFVDISGTVEDGGVSKYRLELGSPGIDAGDSAVTAGTTDFDHHPRVNDGDGNGTAVIDVGALEADPFTRLVPQMPYSVWTQPSGTPLDGLGGWMYPMNTPISPSGQRTPSYLYAEYFGFVSGGAVGQVGLFTDATGRFAVFSVVEPNGTGHNLSVPFNWQRSHFYFPFVADLGGGSWGAWVYDEGAAAWTSIGTLVLPSGWGKLAPASVTAVSWTGPLAGRCDRYPYGDVLVYPPFGFVGGVGSVASLTVSAVGAGDCPPVISTAGPWTRYEAGFWPFT